MVLISHLSISPPQLRINHTFVTPLQLIWLRSFGSNFINPTKKSIQLADQLNPLLLWKSGAAVWPVSAVCWLQEAASPGNGWSPPSSSSEHRVITLSEIRKNVNRVLLRYYALFRRADGRGARARPLLISRVPSNIFTASTHNYAELGVRSWSAGTGASAGICASLPTSVSTAPGLWWLPTSKHFLL